MIIQIIFLIFSILITATKIMTGSWLARRGEMAQVSEGAYS